MTNGHTGFKVVWEGRGGETFIKLTDVFYIHLFKPFLRQRLFSFKFKIVSV